MTGNEEELGPPIEAEQMIVQTEEKHAPTVLPQQRDGPSTSRSSSLKLKIISTLKDLIVAAVLAALGVLAFDAYRNQNRLALHTRLEGDYVRLKQDYMNNSTSHRSAIFFPVDESINALASDDQIRQALFSAVPLLVDGHAHHLDEFALLANGGIPELSCKLWDDALTYEDTHNLWYELRSSYFHAETYLYMMHNAWQGVREGVFTKEHLEYWSAFIDEIGLNPLFLASVHDAVRWGYAPRDFVEWLWNAYRGHRGTVSIQSRWSRLAAWLLGDAELDTAPPIDTQLDAKRAKVLCAIFPDLVADRETWMQNYKIEEWCKSSARPPACGAAGGQGKTASPQPKPEN